MLFFSNDHKLKSIVAYFLAITASFTIFSNFALAKHKVENNFPLVWNITNSNEYFTGRQIIFDQIKNSFKKKQNTITLLGSSGIGKTQVAKRYAELHKQDYDIIWWIDSEKNIDDQFKNLAIAWNKIITVRDQEINTFLATEEIVKQVKDALRTTKLSWLLIIDNAADKTEVKNYLPEKHNGLGLGHVLITSKNPFAWSNIIKLDKFTRDEALELIIKISGKQNKQEAGDLAETLGDFPLALVQASAYIKSHPSLNIKEYKELFLTNRNNLWQEEKSSVRHAAFDNYQSTDFTTFSLIISEIEKTNPESFQLLAFCAFLNNKNIPKTLIIQYLSDIGVIDKLRQEQIITNLLEYSLLTLQESKENFQYEYLPKDYTEGLKLTFTIHEITQLAIQDYLNDNQKKICLETSLKSMIRFLPDKIDHLFPVIEETNFLLPHMRVLSANADKYSVYNNGSAMLKIRELEYVLSGKRNFADSNKLIQNIEDQLLKIPQDNLALMRLHLMKGLYKVWHDFDYQGFVIESNKALELLDTLEGTDDEEYLMVYNRVIQSYILIGDKENALKYIKLGENLIKKAQGFLGNKDVFYHSLARYYMDDEQFDKAYYYVKKAIANKAKIKGKIMFGHLPLHVLACEIMIRGNKITETYKEANYLFKTIKEVIQDNDNLYMAHIMIFLGYSSFLKNSKTKTNANTKTKCKTDISLLIAGQKMLQRVLGEKYNKNRHAAVGYTFLGDIYKKLGKNLRAHTEYVTAENTLNNLYGPKKFRSSEGSDIYAKMAITNVQLADPLTAQKYLTKLQENFGYRNPKTIEVTNYLLEKGLAVGY